MCTDVGFNRRVAPSCLHKEYFVINHLRKYFRGLELSQITYQTPHCDTIIGHLLLEVKI